MRNPLTRWRKETLPIAATRLPMSSAEFFDTDLLYCYGCLHSAAAHPFPSMPSGERPCQFCVRNPERSPPSLTQTWYDGSEPVRTPIDAYLTIDMRDQVAEWLRDAAGPSLEEREQTAQQLLELRKRVFP